MFVRVGVVVVIVVGLLVVGCGDDDGGGSGGVTGSVTSSGEELVAAPITTPAPFPGEDVLPPLAERPPVGKKVAYIQCEVKDCEDIRPGFEKATQALGWEFQAIPSKLQAPGPAVQRAIQAGVDYILIVGGGGLYDRELEEANAKGIKVFSTSDPAPPDPGKGLMSQIADGTSLAGQNADMADWIINKSAGTAKAVYITIPDLPIIDAGRVGFEKEIESKCKDCSFDKIEVTVDDLGNGSIPSQVVAYLQSHPDVTDVVYPFSTAYIGSDAALKAANADVRVTVLADGPAAQVKSGEVAAATVQGNQYLGWAALDQAARVATDSYDPAQERKAAQIPTWVLDNAKEAQAMIDAGNEWPGPQNYEQKFKQLWKVN